MFPKSCFGLWVLLITGYSVMKPSVPICRSVYIAQLRRQEWSVETREKSEYTL